MTIFLTVVSVAGCKDAAITNFLTAVSVAGCKDAAITNFLTAVSVASCEDAAITIFSTAVSVAGCKDAAFDHPWKRFQNGRRKSLNGGARLDPFCSLKPAAESAPTPPQADASQILMELSIIARGSAFSDVSKAEMAHDRKEDC